MKCPNCTHNQLRGQHGMVCKKCGYEFCFDPKKYNTASYKLTDAKFLGILRRASRRDTYYFTEDELYYIAALKSNEKAKGCVLMSILGSMALGAFFSLILGMQPFWLWWLGIALALILVGVWSVRGLDRSLIPRKTWNRCVKKWQKYHGPIPYLIQQPALHQPPPDQPEPDIHDYGASQLIICQHDIQVDWLVLNHFHTANSAIVVSETGYPEYLSKDLDELIQRNPDLKVSLIHDAGEEGEQMVERIQRSWPVDSKLMIDMGINYEMLDQFGVNKQVIKSFGKRFPLHAIPFPILSSLLSKSLVEASTLAISFEVIFSTDGDLDGAADGDGDGE